MRHLIVVLAVALQVAAAEPELRLLPPVVVEGGESWSVEERLKFYNVPGISVAVVEDGRVVFARGYGLADVKTRRPVTTETLFLAGSVSKPVTAIAAIDLVERGKLTLDADVNTLLRSWQLPSNELTAKTPVTLRQLLSHSAGTTVSGFPGYQRGDAVPTTRQILDGAPPANTPPVRVDLAPDTKFRYSGGGTTVAQLALSDTLGEPFPPLMRRLVLVPLGMRDSTYENPLPPAKHARAATGYRAAGRAIPGGWHVYPEMAAAGLWTNPSELARVVIELGDALAGRPSRVLSIDGARLMLTPRFRVGGPNQIGIGFFLDDRGTFGHDGSDEGFVTRFTASKDGRRGVILMTNSDAGGALFGEIERGVARAFAWPTAPAMRVTRAIPEDVLNRAPGRYKQGPDRILTIRRTGDAIELRTIDGRWVKLHYLEDGTLTRTDADQRFRITAEGVDIITGTTVAAARTTEPPSPSELIAEGRLDEGIAAYRTEKPDAQALNRLGGTFQRLGRYRDAVAIFRLATELYPASSNAWDSLAAALFDTGDFAGAAEATRNAIARVDGDTTAEEQAKFWIRLRGKTRLREIGAVAGTGSPPLPPTSLPPVPHHAPNRLQACIARGDVARELFSHALVIHGSLRKRGEELGLGTVQAVTHWYPSSAGPKSSMTSACPTISQARVLSIPQSVRRQRRRLQMLARRR